MNSELYAAFVACLSLMSYAKRSIQSYVRAVRQLQNFCCKALEDIREEDLREYWLYCKDELHWGGATLRISYSGIKLFFTHTLKRDWEVFRLVKFERDTTLPVVLNTDEVRAILDALRYMPQNYAFFTLVYSCGLRLSEALNVQVCDIDGKRQAIHIHLGKGAKDRVVPLPETTLRILREYWPTHKNPIWLFPALGRGSGGKGGKTAEQPVSKTTVQGALRRICKRLGIRKKVTAHTFRHSYATHMIEAGVLVRHVQECLGRFGSDMPEAHRQVIRAICECRSGECGHHLFACPDCGEQHVANSSCGNRHCPVCQNEKAAKWVYQQQLRLLPCTYFMATFTIPEQLRIVARSNQQIVYNAMLDCAAESLRTLEADTRFVGCKVAGFFAVMHTWGRQLQYHPHVHFVIPGGGLSRERSRWVNARGNFLVHVRALSKISHKD